MKAPVVALKQPGNHGPHARINLPENLLFSGDQGESRASIKMRV